MKFRSIILIFPLLIFFMTGPACSLTSNLAARLGGKEEPTPTRPRRFVVMPPAPTPAVGPAQIPTTTAPPLPVPVLPPGPRPRPTATPTANTFLAQLTELLNTLDEPTATPTRAPQLAALPPVPPTPTATVTPLPTSTPTETPMPTPVPTETPVPVPTDTPVPAPTSTAVPAAVSQPRAVAEPAFTSPIATPEVKSAFDFLLAEFFNSPTTNSFLVIYVAIVDPNEIPIGDMKVVGTRLDYNLTYESPLSTWFYEGYNAPGEVIKSGNVKFEPPGGIESANWVLHLEDANGQRMSEDVPFNTDQNDKQWYFIKFKRVF